MQHPRQSPHQVPEALIPRHLHPNTQRKYREVFAWRFNVSSGGTEPRIPHEFTSDDELLHAMHEVHFALVEWRHSAASNLRAEAS